MTDWRESAACLGRVTSPETDLWHDLEGVGKGATETRADRAARVREAKAICAGCPVRQACIDDAAITDARPGPHGIRAGLTGDERKRRRRAKGAA